MRHSFGLRAALMALTVALVGLGLSSSARADSGTITFRVLKGGWFIGASGGSGTLFFHGRRYPLSIGGLSVGLVFGGSETYFQGTVTNIRSPYDVTGIYGAAGAGAAIVAGAQIIALRNEKGAVLRPTGQQVGQRRPERAEHLGAIAAGQARVIRPDPRIHSDCRKSTVPHGLPG